MSKSAEYVNHVSFDDLTPSLVDDQIQHLKNRNLPLTFTNPFVHIPPQYNPMYVESSTRFDDGSPGSSYGSGKRPLLNLDMAFATGSQRDVNSLGQLGPDWGYPDDLRRTKSDMSPDSSRSTSLTRTITTPSSFLSGKLPPAPYASSLKLGKDREATEIEDVDLGNMDRHLEKHIEHETDRNTQENSGSAAGYTTSAFSHLNEVEDKLMKGGSQGPEQSKKPPRRSFADMTDEEVAELEKKYESGARTNYNMQQFDFGEQQQLYIGPELNKNMGAANQKAFSIYPSRPCVTHKALSLSKINRSFDEYLQSVSAATSRDAMRTVLCYISGRRHTWSSVDWYVENAAKDGDYLVIMSRLPNYEQHLTNTKSTQNSSLEEYQFGKNVGSSRRKSDPKALSSTEVGLIIRDVDLLARQKCSEILDYYTEKCSKKYMKITVELIKEDSFEKSLTSAVSLYKPDLQIISTVSTNLQIKFKNGHVKLPFFMMRHYWVPTCVIPFEFINPALLGEPVKDARKAHTARRYKSDEATLDELDQIVLKTLKNPFQPNGGGARAPIDDDSDVEDRSVNSYFPLDPETKRKIEDFERVGYLRPMPTRRPSDLSKVTSYASSNKSSRRSSRVQFRDDYSPVYKVKSLLDASDDVLDDKDGTAVRKTKSISNMSSPPLSRKPSARRVKSHDTVQLIGAKKKSGKLGGFFKKLGFGK